MEDHKFEAAVNWVRPTTVKELQRFLGFANFYHRFIGNFSNIAAPLTSFLKGNPKKITWTDKVIKAFQGLKEAFTSAPILSHSDPTQPFVVEVDTSETGVNAVLSQCGGSPTKLHPVAFYLHKLSPMEQNYGIGNRELLAVKLALEKWRHWFEGANHPFTVLTDHKNLEYLRTAHRLNAHQARWSLFFLRFDLSITYRPGSCNMKADALSRMFQYEITNNPKETPEQILPPEVNISSIHHSFTFKCLPIV
ncbi:hypothetical protein AOLI_G00228490 [Acnodon oligacanthus]